MRLLFLSGRFSSEDEGKWLVQELAEEMCRRGHTADILVTDPTGAIAAGALPRDFPGLRAFQVPGWERSQLGRLAAAKYLPVAARIRWDRRVRSFVSGHYDACFFASPGVLAGGLPGRLRKTGHIAHNVMIIWDFFPIANTEIGALRMHGFSGVLRSMEERVVRGADAVVLMSPQNERFMDCYYSGIKACRLITPPWGVDFDIPAEGAVKFEEFTVVWGGQITHGRALDDLLKVAVAPEVVGEGIRFKIIGDGPARFEYEEMARTMGAHSVDFLGRIPRPDYVRLLRKCHVAASFMTEMSVPSFPSKTVDYCQASLPLLIAAESGTDFDAIMVRAGAARAIHSGDIPGSVTALLDLAAPERRDVLDEMGRASRRFFHENLNVRVAADRVEGLLEELAAT